MQTNDVWVARGSPKTGPLGPVLGEPRHPYIIILHWETSIAYRAAQVLLQIVLLQKLVVVFCFPILLSRHPHSGSSSAAATKHNHVARDTDHHPGAVG